MNVMQGLLTPKLHLTHVAQPILLPTIYRRVEGVASFCWPLLFSPVCININLFSASLFRSVILIGMVNFHQGV